MALHQLQKCKGRGANLQQKQVAESFIERQNLTMRMCMRRFTRLTNAFSRKLINLQHAIALHFMYYNFVRIHQSLRVTPAMEAGVTDRLWSMLDVVALIEQREQEIIEDRERETRALLALLKSE